MPFKPAVVKHHLREFNFARLFNELGWDKFGTTIDVPLGDRTYHFAPVAEKRGFQVFECAIPESDEFPDYQTRLRLDHKVVQSAQQHLLIFTDAARTRQVWQWVKREAKTPPRCRQAEFHAGDSGERLAQCLQFLHVEFTEEEKLSHLDVVNRSKQAFDVEKVTKKFYERFQKEHAAFLAFIEGITAEADRAWYASLMLNRLMFVYFIQRKRFLADDPDYLRNKLAAVRKKTGGGKFHTFYRLVLLRLFHEGLGQKKADRKADLEPLLGDIPYLNGGLFDVHELEAANTGIQIPDEAFDRLFAFFDEWDWTLDTRPKDPNRVRPGQKDEINPDVLGYIFEKYINNKQMGAYYTKEDITGYIARNTVLPFVLARAAEQCAVAFEPAGPVWKLLRDDPDRYIYEAVRTGVDLPLPADIADGITDVAKRAGWNRTAAEGFRLPTETWREHVARRQRCLDLRAKLKAGHVTAANDLVTLNLDIVRFATDLIEGCEGSDQLKAVYHALTQVSVLDPTCGSGAFLFAALNLLDPLYDACLDRMQVFVDEADRSDAPDATGRHREFREVLKEAARHPSRRYFILKSVVVNNLYGVDVMDEAVEICKLRLFLKLVAQVESAKQLEPLPDIDFNVRAGNTLVGFASLAEVGKLLDLTNREELDAIQKAAAELNEKFKVFREYQLNLAEGSLLVPWSKQELRKQLTDLSDRLDRYLAGAYGVKEGKPKAYQQWRDSHKPFHWCVEFYGIMSRGGFDAVIGNPPYVEYSKIRNQYTILNYQTLASGNLYGPCTERSFSILQRQGRFGFIVQAPLVSTQRMRCVRALVSSSARQVWYSTYDDRPSKLFDGMHHARLAIVMAERGMSADPLVFTTRYHKWYSTERDNLFELVGYVPTQVSGGEVVPKFRSAVEAGIIEKLIAQPRRIGDTISESPTKHNIYYKITGVGHWFTFTLQPPKFWRDGKEGSSSRENSASFQSAVIRNTIFCCLYSTLHYWVYQAITNCRDFNPSDLRYLPLSEELAGGVTDFNDLTTRLTKRLNETSETATGQYEVGGAVKYQKFKPKSAKPIIDQIDAALAKHFGFTAEELDFIQNYDIKYRLGAEDGGEDE